MKYDQLTSASFVDHVISGYDFIMRYWKAGDYIYIFGFSRGAYTARLLAEMIHQIGLLSKGNEETVGFAWDTYSKFQQSRGDNTQTDVRQKAKNFMHNFKSTFCRPDVTVHFLGLFDCVNSVGQFEIPFISHSYQSMATPAARHIRHAVSAHERRSKFKPALFQSDRKDNVNCQEVWFAGNHGDIGGVWWPEYGQERLLSDIALHWMIKEVIDLKDPDSKLDLTHDAIKEHQVDFKDLAAIKPKDKRTPHDMLRFGRGAKFLEVIPWWLLEILPFSTQVYLADKKQIHCHFQPNLGHVRKIPDDAIIHPSIKALIEAGVIGPPSISHTSWTSTTPQNVLILRTCFQQTSN